MLSMCMVTTWQGPRNQASWNRQVKEDKWAGMGACTPGRTRRDSSALEIVVGVGVGVGAGAGAGAERCLVSHLPHHERNGDGAVEGGDQEWCLRHRVDRPRGRLPLIGAAPGACWC